TGRRAAGRSRVRRSYRRCLERVIAGDGVPLTMMAAVDGQEGTGVSEGDPGQGGRERLGLAGDAEGVLPNQVLERAVQLGILDAGEYRIPPASIQPASVDLRLGKKAYRIRCSFLPDNRPVEVK